MLRENGLREAALAGRSCSAKEVVLGRFRKKESERRNPAGKKNYICPGEGGDTISRRQRGKHGGGGLWGGGGGGGGEQKPFSFLESGNHNVISRRLHYRVRGKVELEFPTYQA